MKLVFSLKINLFKKKRNLCPNESSQNIKIYTLTFLHLNILLLWQDFTYYQVTYMKRFKKTLFLSEFRFFGSSPLWNPICICGRIRLVSHIHIFLNFRFFDLIFDLSFGFEIILNVRFELKRKIAKKSIWISLNLTKRKSNTYIYIYICRG